MKRDSQCYNFVRLRTIFLNKLYQIRRLKVYVSRVAIRIPERLLALCIANTVSIGTTNVHATPLRAKFSEIIVCENRNVSVYLKIEIHK